MRAVKISSLIFTLVLLLLIVVYTYRDPLLFTTGHGDVGSFILQTAEHYGGTPITTNGLPFISDQWRYCDISKDVVIHLAQKKFPAVETFLKQSFGKEVGWGGDDYRIYRLSTNGVTVYLYGCGDVTEIIICSHPKPNFSMMPPNRQNPALSVVGIPPTTEISSMPFYQFTSA